MFSLTQQEKTVVLFLLGLALLGLGAQALFKRYARVRDLPQLSFKKEKINLNNATEEQLVSLPGIGPVSAHKLIEYRQANGGFTDLADLKLIKGLRNQTLEKIEDLV
ncbi:MAG: helix-hairpin-helix domain-containing protein, partial [Candidatus Omnitrophica bacterium]|nr:helix-hairpin-helix domain-containing protein [Candidatus Omnitrophota bacterium]